jgi:hypothetical protein
MGTLESIASLAQVILAFSSLVVTAVLTILVYRGSRQIAYIEYWRAVRDAWMQIDEIALSDDDNLRVADSLFHPDLANQTSDDRRKRWLGLMVLNNFLSQYFGPSESLPDPELLRGATLSQMEPLIRDDVFYGLTQSGLYDPEFEEVCRRLRQEQQ